MWLRVPDAIDQPLWEGELEPDDSAPDIAHRDSKLPSKATNAVRDLPIVSIGSPEVWNLVDLYHPDTLPATMRAKLAEARFYLVRLSCSFRPAHDRTRIEWARFSVSLKPDATGQVANAFDLHPLLVSQDVKRNLKVSISPTLKFREVEAGIGGIDFGFEYTEIQPTISASGAGESEPAWDFSTAAGSQVQGSKWMHLLLKVSTAMTVCDASLQLTADVVRTGVRIPVFSRPKQTSADPLTVRLCG
jgi:hypothetical protein